MKKIHPQTLSIIEETRKVLVVGHYSRSTITNYTREIKFIGEFYSKIPVNKLKQKHIRDYIIYVREDLCLGRAKCRMVAHSLSFLFKEVLNKPYVLPSKLYPKKAFRIPKVMSVNDVRQLLEAPLTLKQRAICEVFYSTGVRMSECCRLRIRDVDSVNLCIHLHQGKGNKDRMLLLSPRCLETLKEYYKAYSPVEYLFEGKISAQPCSTACLRFNINQSMKLAGLKEKHFSAHTFRHSFATHLLNNGVDLLSIQMLMGHKDLRATMVYLHLQVKRLLSVVSPLDALYGRNDLQTDFQGDEYVV